jgi:glycerol uptake facilitator-like aquaporin
MFVGGFLLAAAVMVWATGIFMSPHGDTVAEGTEHVRNAVVIYLRNAAIGTLVLSSLAAILLFPVRRPRTPRRDWAIGLLIFALIATSLYQLYWLRASVGA